MPTVRADISTAARLAYSLEDTVRVRHAEIRTRSQLREIFGRGFESKIADRLTDRLWDSTSTEPKGTELSIAAPDSIVVLAVKGDSAEVAFVTPVRARWTPAQPYTVAWLRRQGGVWRIGGARDTADAPALLPRPEPMPDQDP